MKETLNLAIRLFLITAVAGLLLGSVNSITAPIITAQEVASLQEALKTTYPEAEEFVPLDEGKLTEIQGTYPNVTDVFTAKVGGNDDGYVYQVFGRGGYGGDILLVVGVNGESNEILGYDVLQSSETPGLGTQIEEEPFVGSVIGKSVNEPLVSSQTPQAENEIQAIAGTTISVDAVLDGLNSVVEVNKALSN